MTQFRKPSLTADGPLPLSKGVAVTDGDPRYLAVPFLLAIPIASAHAAHPIVVVK